MLQMQGKMNDYGEIYRAAMPVLAYWNISRTEKSY